MAQFSTKIYDKRDDFDFDIVNFRFFLMETSLDVHHMVFTYLSLFVSLEHLLMSATSIVGTKP